MADKDGLSAMQRAHRTRLEQLREEATSVAGTALKIAQAIEQVLKEGGGINVQPQMSFLTGAFARMTKDVGVVEFLQSQGINQKPRPKIN